MIRWLVVGSRGMLGSDLMDALIGRDAVGLDLPEIDITDLGSVTAAIRGTRPDVVVNSAAWTAVDAAEEQEATAFQVNAVGPANVARACARAGAGMVQISTDYVFDGQASTPYGEDAALRPASAYGRTKAAGEWAVRAYLPGRAWIVRTAWLYGARGPNFVRTMMSLEGQRETVDVVDDQRGQPTWTVDLAAAIIRVVDASAPAGVYNGTSTGETTWYGLAREIFLELGADPGRVRPTTSASLNRPAKRPAYSVLGHEAWARSGLPPLRHWRDALTAAMKELQP